MTVVLPIASHTRLVDLVSSWRHVHGAVEEAYSKQSFGDFLVAACAYLTALGVGIGRARDVLGEEVLRNSARRRSLATANWPALDGDLGPDAIARAVETNLGIRFASAEERSAGDVGPFFYASADVTARKVGGGVRVACGVDEDVPMIFEWLGTRFADEHDSDSFLASLTDFELNASISGWRPADWSRAQDVAERVISTRANRRHGTRGHRPERARQSAEALVDSFKRPARFFVAEDGGLSAKGACASTVAVAMRDERFATVLHVAGDVYAD